MVPPGRRSAYGTYSEWTRGQNSSAEVAHWLQRLHVLFFMDIGSRCVHLAGCTLSPTSAWVVQQARQQAWLLQDGKIRARLIIRDRDAKFTVRLVIPLVTYRRDVDGMTRRW